MRKELSKTYDPKQVEEKLYQKWLDKGYFHAEVDHGKKPFTIVIPPPNITGQLHMGHALDEYDAGCAHPYQADAGIFCAVDAGNRPRQHRNGGKDRRRAAQTRALSKEELGREEFLERAWAMEAASIGGTDR